MLSPLTLSPSPPLLEFEVTEEDLIKCVNIFQLCLHVSAPLSLFLVCPQIFHYLWPQPSEMALNACQLWPESPCVTLSPLFFTVTIFWCQRLGSLPHWPASTILAATCFYPSFKMYLLLIPGHLPLILQSSFPSNTSSYWFYLLSYSPGTCVTGVVV